MVNNSTNPTFGISGEHDTECKIEQPPLKGRNKASLESVARNAHKVMRDDTRSYFNERGINNVSIDKFMLGSREFYGCSRFTIPVFDKNGDISYIKLWETPDYEEAELVAKAMGKEAPYSQYAVYPADAELLLVGEDQLVKSTSSDVLICKDELDRIIAVQEGVEIPVVTAGAGTQIFKDEWIESLRNMRNIYICMNGDEADKLARRLAKHLPTASIYKILLPTENGVHISLRDYFIMKHGTADGLFSEYATFCCGAEPIDESKFQYMGVGDIANVLDLTIKHDFVSKVVTFLVMLLAYTESDQQNVMFNADSSTGKTYICSKVSEYFPSQDVKVYGKTTPTAFYYSLSLQKKDEKTGQTFIDLERRILIFTEQPDTQLQENLRALLSHDNKRIPFAITNKSQGGKNVAMEGYILGYPSTFFCSANMQIDEQEQTRCLILSPENSPEKIMAGIDTSIIRNSHKDVYDAEIKNNEDRKQLIERVLYIKSLKVKDIDIEDSEYLKSRFMEGRNILLPKAQREISHFISLVKAMALINAPFRIKGDKIVATNKEVDEAMKLWACLAESMSHGVSPQVLGFYKKYILPAYYIKNQTSTAKPKGVTYDEIRIEYYNRTGSYPNMENIRKQYIPALRTASMISYNKDEDDKRQKLITPLAFFEDNMDKEV